MIEAEQELENFTAKWDAKYPTISRQCRLKWPHVTAMFEMPRPIRKVMYTTNQIESVDGVIRKFTRNCKQYPNRDSALKMIYIGISEASKRWTKALHNWKEALNHFAIMFEDRMPARIDELAKSRLTQNCRQGRKQCYSWKESGAAKQSQG